MSILLRSKVTDAFNDQTVFEVGLFFTYASDSDTEIRPTNRCQGKGLFATTNISSQTIIGEYTGTASSGVGTLRQTQYQMYTSTGTYIDAKHSNCKARYINHATSHANAITREMYACKPSRGKPARVFIVASKPIKAGSEILYNYGDDYWVRRGLPNLS
jgi:SET domain-containing protein